MHAINIELLSKTSLEKHKAKGFQYIHIGLVQVGLNPLARDGLNTSILVALRDRRFRIFQDSLLGTIESSLCKGPISFDCYPNFTVSLSDANLLKSLVLQIQTCNYDMLKGSILVVWFLRYIIKLWCPLLTLRVNFIVNREILCFFKQI